MKTILGLLCFGLSVANAASLVFDNPSKPMVLPKGTTQFEIVLKSNPSTGYAWFLTNYNATLIKPISWQYHAITDKKRIGAPGESVWTFAVLSGADVVPQSTTLSFEYVRPWENASTTPTVVVVRVE